jgi:hypothetical protein
MNYLQIHNKIINHAKLRNSTKKGALILESHHIIPRHCGGSNLKDNKVNLTLREHFLCHVLLAKIYKNTEFYAGMCRAVVAMSQRGSASSKFYESIKTQHVNNLKKQIISDEQKNAISCANKGNKSRTGMKNSTEHIEILRLSRLGSKHSDTTKEKWSQIRKGRPAYNAGLTGDASPLFRIAKPKITCPHCNKEGGAPAMKRFHFENCNFKKVV